MGTWEHWERGLENVGKYTFYMFPIIEYERERKGTNFVIFGEIMLEIRICPICGKDFMQNTGKQIYCGDKECLRIANNKYRKRI